MRDHPIYKIYSHIDVAIAVVCMVLLISITFVGVIMRYLLNSPIVWQEEAQLALIIWISFYGASYAFREKSHIAIDILVEALPVRLQKAATTAAYLITMGVLAFMLHNGYRLFGQFLETKKVSTSLRIPSAAIYSAVPIGLGLMMISASLAYAEGFRKEKGGKDHD